MYAMNEVLTKHAAYVNKFLGDGIMTVWGAFERDTPHAQNACRAALECFERLAEFNRSKEVEGLPDLSMRIGIATGVVTLGDCGAPPDLQDYTVIGDTANLAARLESANKQFGTRILINGRTKELLSEDIVTRPLGRVTVVGQKRPSEIHEVMGIAGSLTAEDQERITKTQGAVAAFAEQRFDDARAAWNSLRADPRTATLAGLYLEELDAPAENFDGVLHLTKK
jgi:adenylate cyclase